MNINNLTANTVGNKFNKPNASDVSAINAKKSDDFKTALAGSRTKSSPTPALPARMDKIQFSHSAPSMSSINSAQFSQIKNKITSDMQDVQNETKSEKLDRIAKQVENNEYKIDPYELAKIMFRA